MQDSPAERCDQPCPCGTGLSAACCCDFDAAAARPLADATLLARIPEAQDAWRAGHHASAEKLALLILEQAPHEPRALRLLAEIRTADGKERAAAILLKRLIALEPHNYWAINKFTRCCSVKTTSWKPRNTRASPSESRRRIANRTI